MDNIEKNIRHILQNIQIAEVKRSPKGECPVQLIAVTKNHGVAAVEAAAAAGLTIVGENRVQEATEKQAQASANVKWHLIGHLQTNKAKQAVKLFDLIQSVDSWHLAEALNKAALTCGKRQDILLQVNIANEATKFGLPAEETMDMAQRVAATLPGLRLCGLMTIAPFVEDAEMVRPYFKEMKRLFLALKELALPGTDFRWLSMGMTNDYQVAVEEGANLIRVGTGIFGPRSYGVQGGL
ncbi:YggS family pyridoxal phosphate-dependent enzyme [Azotosporobacter soli]|uniref:YggS family pyridoxal phosphate-dependent enzyme n=1 Tax=Azotosporobacter soli TaxID=3055040 RepID=UPI0031FEFBBD